jgi:membrane protein
VTLPPALKRLIDRVTAWPPVRTAQSVLTAFDAAGGGLLAGGLTYSALFALLPTLLLLTGILGLVVDDPERRRAILESLGDALPPLREFLEANLDALTDGATGFGILGLLGLAWGASRFYGSLDDALGRIFSSDPRRGLVAKTVRGLLSVVLLISVFVIALVLTGIASYLAAETAAALGTEARTFWGVVTPALSAVVFVITTGAVYRLLPARTVSWRALWWPALVIGIALAGITQLFSFIAPRLIGTAAVYGAFVAIFAAMIWLSALFQVLLLGAAWVRVRLDGDQGRT